MKKETGFTDIELVRMYMAIKGLTKEQTHKELGVSRNTLYMWLYGKQRIADFRKRDFEKVIYEFIQKYKRFKPSKPIER